MTALSDLSVNWADSPAIKGREERYVTLDVDVARTIESWRRSLYAFEWLTEEGEIRAPGELGEAEAEKRRAVEAALDNTAALDKPVLGIGMFDNVEIGAGRAVFLTLAAQGATTLPVHIPKSQREEFSAFLA